jgi:tRNA (guanine-N7-)-methyltransferase
MTGDAARQHRTNVSAERNLPPPLPRSVYAGRLSGFHDFAFADSAAFNVRGTWADFFRRRIGGKFDGRVIVEIGCYNAGYLSRIAAKYPNTAFIGMDWKCKAIYDGARAVTALELNNIALLRARAQDIARIFNDGEVEQMWVFFPDPCNAGVELTTRLIDRQFLIDSHRILRDTSSTLSFKSDDLPYYQWVHGLFGGNELAGSGNSIRDRFEITCSSTNFWEDPSAQAHCLPKCFAGEMTTYEGRFVKKRLPIHFVDIRKS